MSKEAESPYIVSQDTYNLLRKWASKNGYTIPSADYFGGLSKRLRETLIGYFGNVVEILEEKEISSGLRKLIRKSKWPVVSLDRAYITAETPNVLGFIDVTRAVDENLERIDGLRPRPGSPSLEIQLERIRRKGYSQIALADDVIFTGRDLAEIIIPKLANLGVRVVEIYAGVGVGQGTEFLRQKGIGVTCVKEYPQVIDEVCQRDFFAGVPMSGRTVITKEGKKLSAPYFLPFGRPVEWASIPPERVVDFSEFCLAASLELWKKIQELSDQKVPLSKLPRKLTNNNQELTVTEFLSNTRIK